MVVFGIPQAQSALLVRRQNKTRKSAAESSLLSLPATLALSGRHVRGRLAQEVTVSDQVLGRGTSGDVRLGWRASGRRCAVKSVCKRAPQLALLRSECELHLRLDHPHVVRLECVYEEKDRVHLVLEHLAGGELQERLRRGRFPEAEAAGLLEQMLLGLAHVHARGVVHGDLKPENVLFEAGDHLKIIDFGLASAAGARAEAPRGTLDYAAPEVFDLRAGTSSDVWSLGVVAYTLLTGHSPWHARDDVTLIMIQAGKPNFAAERFQAASPMARDFVKRLLSFDHAARPSAAEALQHPWIRRAMAPRDQDDASILSSLRDFARASPLRRACCRLAAWHLDVATQAAARRRFLQLARATGDVAPERLRMLLEARVEAAEAAEVCACFDACGISFTAFLAAAVPASELLGDERLSESFLRFDADADGRVTAADVDAVLGRGAFAEAVALEIGTGVCLADLQCFRGALALREKESEPVYETQSVGEVEDDKDVDATKIMG